MPVSLFRFRRFLLLVLACLVGLTAPLAAQEAEETGFAEVSGPYRLGAADQINLRVVVWDSVTLNFSDLEAISGAYEISSDGSVMLPIVGRLEAAGSTTDELSVRVADALQTNTGLSETPSVAIGVLKYRPIFVLGDVARPGEYPFRPGMRAVQLLALAGGYYRLAEEQGSGLVREGVRVAGALREIRVDQTSARIREARLQAEASGAEDFLLPTGLSHPDGQVAIDWIYESERRLMQTRRDALARSVESLNSSRELLETEVRILGDKKAGLDRQIELMAEAVGNIETLAERGLTVSSNLLNMQRALFDLESRQLDAENQTFRARQSIGDIERSLNETTQRRATDVLTELQEVQAQIARLDVRSETQQRVLVETQAEAALATSEEDQEVELVPVFRVSREIDGKLVTRLVEPETVLVPLDVLDVRWTDPADLAKAPAVAVATD